MSIGTKLLLVSVATAAGTMTGLFFSKRLKARSEYYKALIAFMNYILAEVKFRRNPVKAIIRDFMNLGETPLSKNLSEYLETDDPKDLKLTKGYLKSAETFEIRKFLSALGSVDAETQSFELEAEKERFSGVAAAAALHREKYSSMYIKLGFFAGLALGVLLL